MSSQCVYERSPSPSSHRSLESLFTSTKLDEELRTRLEKNFPEFYHAQSV